jgi:hypothetical protein
MQLVHQGMLALTVSHTRQQNRNTPPTYDDMNDQALTSTSSLTIITTLWLPLNLLATVLHPIDWLHLHLMAEEEKE